MSFNISFTIKAQMVGQKDADAFNELAIYCAKKLSKMDAVQNGGDVAINIHGPEEMIGELRDYLVERKMGVI